MNINIECKDSDDIQFVQIVHSILNTTLSNHSPRFVAEIKVNNWFSHKWLTFSGVIQLQLGVWKSEVTIPPFVPNRIIHENTYSYYNSESYRKININPIHIKQYSQNNLSREIKNTTKSGLFIWWSGNSKLNEKGSLMVYLSGRAQTFTWFASFDKHSQWDIYKTKQIDKEELARLINE